MHGKALRVEGPVCVARRTDRDVRGRKGLSILSEGRRRNGNAGMRELECLDER